MRVQPVVSRSQRRVERKQLVLIVVLIIAVAGISFSLGVMFGRRNVPVTTLSSPAVKPTSSSGVTQVAPPPTQPEVVTEKPEKLTFYENLPKGNQAPLGSGINLPPDPPEISTAEKSKKDVKPESPPTAPLEKSVASPRTASSGAFVVQVASFRTSEDAKKLASRIEGYNLSTFIESADLGEKGLWYRVLAGPYANRGNAVQAAGLLKEKERLSALVRQR